jgi:transposase
MPKRRKFSPEFKREAVAMTEMSGATVRQVAADLDIGEGMLGRWRRELRQHGDKVYISHGPARDEEVLRLKRELARVKRERDVLKEAAAFFVKEPK